MVLIPLGVFFFAQLLKQISNSRPLSIIIYSNLNNKTATQIGAALVYLFFAFSVAYFILVTRSDYMYFNQGFKISW